MAKNVKDAYGEILRLRNEFYQKWQETSQYDDNRGAYKAKYEAFDKAQELLTPSIVDSQPEDSDELTHSVTKKSDQEESISEDLLDEIHNRWKDDPHIKWPKCPYKDFKNNACHFANWQKQQMMKDAVDAFIYKGGIRLKKWPLPEKCGEHLDPVKVIIIKEDKV